MKPEINTALITLAQELIQRFSPLLQDEYEQSRLNSWGTLLLMASMDLDKAADNLIEQNKLIKAFLKKYSRKIIDRDLIKEIDLLTKVKKPKYDILALDEFNQEFRGALVKTQAYFEKESNSEALKEIWKILRVMHNHRKVSHLLTPLKS